MKRFIVAALIAAVLPLPVRAQQVSPVSQAQLNEWHAQYQQAWCTQNWEQAIVVADRMLSVDLEPAYKQQLMSNRQTLIGYRERRERFSYMPGCSGGQVVGSSDPGSDARWDRAIQSVGGSAGRGANSSSSPSYSSGSNYGSPGGTGSGNCDYSWQTDSAGRSCGGRAASERPGGRLGGSSYSTPSYTPSYSSGGSGSTYVRPYTRSDGTYVRGHMRRR